VASTVQFGRRVDAKRRSKHPATPMRDHPELISLKGESYRLKDRDLGPRPTSQRAEPG
jgi:hypothetical protein